jgi:hypothetical protein
MKWRLVPLLAVLALLVLPGTSSSSSATRPDFGFSSQVVRNQNHVAYLKFYFTGKGVKTVMMYYVGTVDHVTTMKLAPSKYLRLTPTGTTKYYVSPEGEKYWVLQNPARNITEKSSVTLAIKVNPAIPRHKLSCVLTRVIALAPGYRETYQPGRGSCRAGQEWMTPIPN